MSAGSPASPQIAGLVRHLQPPPDAALWVGTLRIHRLQATVPVADERPALPELGVLRAVRVLGSATTVELSELIGIPLASLVRRLGEQGMLTADPTGRWRLTPQGQRQLDEPQTSWPRWQRRKFHFLHHPDGRPRYIALTVSGPGPLAEPQGRGSEPKPSDLDAPALAEALDHCIQQSGDWKRLHRFPLEVRRMVPDAPEPWAGAAPRGCRPAAVRNEQYSLAVVLHKDGLYAFLASPLTWTLAVRDPILSLTSRDAVAETFGELLADPDPESWHAAWRGWCQARGIPLPEASGIHIQRRGLTLVVSGHPLRPERLRALTMDEENWLLAGTGPLRCAARLEFGRPSPHP